ncbi:MAG: ABC transporter permease [Dehalococcoidales bacterium]|nr:ABC transporter permease [Dehalococcoidales bacterium]
MNLLVIWALVRKDLSLAIRNRFFAVVLVLGLVVYAAVYLVMPPQADEEISFGIAGVLPPGLVESFEGEEGIVLEQFESASQLKKAIEEGSIAGGLELPDGFIDSVTSGLPASASVYYNSAAPEEYRGALQLMLEEIAYALAGKPLEIEVNTTVLGRDTLGSAVAPRDRLLPLFAVFIILTEMMSLASLLSEEIETGTIKALMVTPLNLRGLFLAKGLTGTGMAFGQVLIFMCVVGGFSSQPGLVLVVIFSGAVMAAGIGFLVAAVGKDLMSVMAWGVLALLVFSIPAFGVIFPGTISDWAKVIPSYYLVNTLNQAVNYNASFGQMWADLLWITGFNLAFILAGMWTVKRRLG